MPSCVQRFLISGPDLGIDVSFSPLIPSFVHRFLISGLDLGIDVSFSPLTPSFVHRFLISRPDLRIDAWFCLFMPSCVHRFSISGPDLRIDATQSSWRWRMARLLWLSPQRGPRPILFVVAAKENGSPAAAVAATRSASDSILRCRKGEWPACSGRSSNEVPSPILFFVVAKENSFACSSRSGGDLPHPNNSLKP